MRAGAHGELAHARRSRAPRGARNLPVGTWAARRRVVHGLNILVQTTKRCQCGVVVAEAKQRCHAAHDFNDLRNQVSIASIQSGNQFVRQRFLPREIG